MIIRIAQKMMIAIGIRMPAIIVPLFSLAVVDGGVFSAGGGGEPVVGGAQIGVPAQVPALHVSILEHGSWSSQAVPSAAIVYEHPSPEVQVPLVRHATAGHDEFVPAHVPLPSHWSN